MRYKCVQVKPRRSFKDDIHLTENQNNGHTLELGMNLRVCMRHNSTGYIHIFEVKVHDGTSVNSLLHDVELSRESKMATNVRK